MPMDVEILAREIRAINSKQASTGPLRGFLDVSKKTLTFPPRAERKSDSRKGEPSGVNREDLNGSGNETGGVHYPSGRAQDPEFDDEG